MTPHTLRFSAASSVRRVAFAVTSQHGSIMSIERMSRSIVSPSTRGRSSIRIAAASPPFSTVFSAAALVVARKSVSPQGLKASSNPPTQESPAPYRI